MKTALISFHTLTDWQRDC